MEDPGWGGNPLDNRNRPSHHADRGQCERCFRRIDRRGNGSDVLCRKCWRKCEAHYATVGTSRACPVCGGHDRPRMCPCRRCGGKGYLPTNEEARG